MSSLYHKSVHDYINENSENVFNFLKDLVRIPSSLGNEYDAQLNIKDKLVSIGINANLFEADLSILPDHPGHTPVNLDDHFTLINRPNVIGTLNNDDDNGRSLMLSSHIEQSIPVGPLDLWKYDPYGGEIDDGKMYGRGVANDKAGIISMIVALDSILKCNYQLNGDVILISALGGRDLSEGESGGLLACAANGYQADAGLYLHPLEVSTGLSEIEIASMGALHFKITVKGKQSQSVQNINDGVNAINKAFNIINSLNVLNSQRQKRLNFKLMDNTLGYSTSLNISNIITEHSNYGDVYSDNNSLLHVPDYCEFQGRIIFPPGETWVSVSKEIEMILHDCSLNDPWLSSYPPELTLLHYRADPVLVDVNEPIITCVSDRIYELTNVSPILTGQPIPSDIRFMNLYANTPTVKIGSLGGNMNDSNEWVDLDDLLNLIKITSSIIMEWCGVSSN